MKNMKFKTAIQYQLTDLGKPMAIFYAVLYGGALAVTAIAMYLMGDEAGGFSGLDVSSIIFLMFCGVYAFLEDFQFFIQNGLTRRTIFQCQMTLFLIAAVFMGTFELMVEFLVLNNITEYVSMFDLIYGTDPVILVKWLWRIGMYFMVTNLAFLSSILQNRIGKRAFVLILIALGLILVVLLPAVNNFLDGAVADRILPILLAVMGITENGLQMLYPFLTFLGLSAVFMAGSYCLIRRAEVK